jgi:hypothetical protein
VHDKKWHISVYMKSDAVGTGRKKEDHPVAL